MVDKAYAQFVVTVLRDNAPVAVIEAAQTAEQMAETEVYYPDDALLPEVADALRLAYHACGFLIWQQTGQPPTPIDYDPDNGEDEIVEPPF